MRVSVAGCGLLVWVMLQVSPLQAQIANLPADVRAKIVGMGAVLNPELVSTTFSLFTPLHKANPRPEQRTHKALSYGTDPREILDVYQPPAPASAPIVIYVHGGGFVRGTNNFNDVMYSNIAVAMTRQGLVGVNATYPLAPGHGWPAGSEAVGKMVAWAKAHGAEYGGDPKRIFLMGHSAGAAHVAGYVLNPALQPKDGAGVAGAILVSGPYRVDGMDANDKAYYGSDASQYALRSPITHVNESRVPLFLVYAEYDPMFLAEPTLEMARAICTRDRRCPRVAWLKGHNHISEMASIDTADRELSGQIVDFVNTTP